VKIETNAFGNEFKSVISELQKIQNDFNSKSDLAAGHWKDQRQVAFFQKHVNSRKDELNKLVSDLSIIEQQVSNMVNELKRYINN
jgi:hypothetical protein